jgi:hypothetical protein
MSNMKRNNLGYLGLLGLTGLLGFINPGLFSLFSFFTLFVFSLKSDERIDKHIGQASRNAFIYDTIITIIALTYIVTSKTFEASPIFPILLTQGLTIFSVSYAYYQQNGD